MAQKKAFIGLVCFFLVTLLLIGGFAMAAEIGDKDNPLVTLSYIMQDLQPELIKQVDTIVAQKKTEYETKMDELYRTYSADLQQKITDFEAKYTGNTTDDAFVDKVADAVIAKMGSGASASSGTAPVASSGGSTFQRVVVEKGKTITFKEGAQIVHRLGSGTVVAASSPGLVDLTTAGSVNNGQSVVASHMFLVTIDGNGIKATEKMTMFVLGSYTIS